MGRGPCASGAKSGGAPLGWPFWLCVLPLLALAVWLLFTHTLYLKGGAYWCGQSTYGDLPMHLAFIPVSYTHLTLPTKA